MKTGVILSAISICICIACLKKNCDNLLLPSDTTTTVTPLPEKICTPKINSWSDPVYITGSGLSHPFFINEKTGWIPGYNGTILKTSDGGATFIYQSPGTPRLIDQIFFTDEKNGYAGGGNKQTTGMVLKSADGGNTWKIILDSLDSIRCMYFSSKDTGFIAAHLGELTKTTDGGKTWRPIVAGIPYKAMLYELKFVNKTGYASGANGIIIKSEDGGETWKSIDNILPKGDNDGILGMDLLDENICYFGGYSMTNDMGYIMRTTDGGKTLSVFSIKSFNVQGVTAANKDTAYAAGVFQGSKGALYMTTNGNDWTMVKSTPDVMRDMAFIGCDKAIISGGNGMIIRGNE